MELHRIFYIFFHSNSFVIKSQFYSILLHLLNGVPLESLYTLYTRGKPLFFRQWTGLTFFTRTTTVSYRTIRPLVHEIAEESVTVKRYPLFVYPFFAFHPPSSEIQTFRIICIVGARLSRIRRGYQKYFVSAFLSSINSLCTPRDSFFILPRILRDRDPNVIALVAIKKIVETYCVPYCMPRCYFRR